MWSETHTNSLAFLLAGEEETCQGQGRLTMNTPVEQGSWGPKRPSVGGWGLQGGKETRERACQRMFCLNGIHTIPDHIFILLITLDLQVEHDQGARHGRGCSCLSSRPLGAAAASCQAPHLSVLLTAEQQPLPLSQAAIH